MWLSWPCGLTNSQVAVGTQVGIYRDVTLQVTDKVHVEKMEQSI